ncbi:glycosyltransferase family 2 protein [Patescibacteria group bacterium]|nr:glycosyltransferase family 2 protein [Patescibacteria group bacterium]MBU0964476.1 glycosyltransferase family 2 protein [Patescibacteria group bacterium]
MSQVDTCVIILNWNGQEHLATCLDSVLGQSYDKYEVILIDNGSKDDSVEFISKNYPQVKIIQNKKNYGFAEGNNIAIREVLKNKNIKYIATLNNDTEVDREWLAELVRAVEADQKIGAVSSKFLFFNERNMIDSAGDFLYPGSLKVVTRGYKEQDKGQYDKLEQCFSARAGAALYRREMLEDIRQDNDFFDHHFFTYIEDTDLSVRALLKGWKILYAPKARVFHKVAATTSKISYAFRRYHSGRNRVYLAIKNFPVKLWLPSLREKSSVDSDYKLSVLNSALVYIKILSMVLISFPRLLKQRSYINKSRIIKQSEIFNWLNEYAIKK